MGILDRLKKDGKSDVHSSWKHLTTETQLHQALEDSHDKMIALFKHSTRCGISVRAKMLLEEGYDIPSEQLDFYYLDLLKYRPISALIAELTEVIHQSPQVIVIQDGKVVFDETHHEINLAELKEVVAEHLNKFN